MLGRVVVSQRADGSGSMFRKGWRNGSDIFFWTGPCVGGTPLCEQFGRLFDLTETKLRTVAEMFSLAWGRKGWRGCGGCS
ncbi:hypothetical protein A2U01_0028501 [Trifolium medium]|uniref:Uncharacterized protein n=1 Tax=Trifolium medium TaxID=97028 RepID=A0A392P6Q8_9FABA|nr:hypothetical protein [Trifolium medium]